MKKKKYKYNKPITFEDKLSVNEPDWIDAYIGIKKNEETRFLDFRNGDFIQVNDGGIWKNGIVVDDEVILETLKEYKDKGQEIEDVYPTDLPLILIGVNYFSKYGKNVYQAFKYFITNDIRQPKLETKKDDINERN